MERRTATKFSRLCPDPSLAATASSYSWIHWAPPIRSSYLLAPPNPTMTLRLSLDTPSTDPLTPSQSESKWPKKRVNCEKVLYEGFEFQDIIGKCGKVYPFQSYVTNMLEMMFISRRGKCGVRHRGIETDSNFMIECRVCFRPTTESKVMIECDDCLGGFHH